jgi:phosphoserine phosphatase
MIYLFRSVVAVAAIFVVTAAAAAETDPLPSWNDGATKQAIVSFVEKVTDKDGKDYVPPEDRIATFDNDGNLWAEKPVYFQLLFAIDRVKALAPEHPEWKDQQPFKAAIEGDMKTLAASGEKGIAELVMASHAGMTPAEFQKIVGDWLATAEHPRFKRHYTDLVYQPMLELLSYLRDNGFTTFIVSGGGIEFVRNFSEAKYGIPPAQSVCLSLATGTAFALSADSPRKLSCT